jgi:hypothetical protein
VALPVSPFVDAHAHLRLSALPSSGPMAAPFAAESPPRRPIAASPDELPEARLRRSSGFGTSVP